MTVQQQWFLNQLELALAKMAFDGYKDTKGLGAIVEWLDRDEPAIAVLEGEHYGVANETLNCIRKVFDVRY
jgi:hypothetical protein